MKAIDELHKLKTIPKRVLDKIQSDLKNRRKYKFVIIKGKDNGQ